MPERRAFGLAFAAFLLAGVCALLVPPLLPARDVVVSTPGPPPLQDVTPVRVLPYALLCVPGADVGPDAAVVRFLRARSGPPVAVAVEVRGAAGTDARGRAVAPGAAGPIDVRVRPAAREQAATVCVRNRGTAPLELVGSTEVRTLAAPVATLDGRALGPRVALTLLEARRRSLLARVPAVLAHATAFRPAVLGRPELWALLVAVIVSLPAGVAAAMFRAWRPPGR